MLISVDRTFHGYGSHRALDVTDSRADGRSWATEGIGDVDGILMFGTFRRGVGEDKAYEDNCYARFFCS